MPDQLLDNDKPVEFHRRIKGLAGRARNHWLVVAIVLIGGVVVFGGNLFKGITSTIEFFTPKPDALSVAREDAKDRLSREFVETVSRRLFLSRNFLARLQRRAHESEIHDAWNKLLAQVEYMASKTLIYSISLEEFYSSARRFEFEGGIQDDFNKITESLVLLRYSPAVQKLEFPSRATVPLTENEGKEIDTRANELRGKLDALNIRIYQFSNCFDKKSQNSTGCKYAK